MRASFSVPASAQVALEKRLKRLEQLHPKRMDLSLARLRRLLVALDHPEKHLPPVVRIAGTNGKGSTLAFLEAIAHKNNWVCDSYISPHLVRFNERVRLNGTEVDTASLVSALERAEEANAGAPITFFEITTAAALIIFAEAHAKRKRDLLLLEVGLGGRLDATAVVPKWVLAVLTPIDLDHQGFLGTTLDKIAGEKAAIIKAKTPAVSAKQKPAARQVLEVRADKMVAPLLLGGRDWRVVSAKQNEAKGAIKVQGAPFPALENLSLTPNLLGKHQQDNAALAAVAAAWLGAKPKAIQDGIKSARWHARLQRLTHGSLPELLPSGWQVWLDGGHNPAAARTLASFIKQNDSQNDSQNNPGDWCFIVSLIAGKSARGFLSALLSATPKNTKPLVIAVAPPADHQAIPPAQIAKLAQACGAEGLTAQSLTEAITKILNKRASPQNKRENKRGKILICGSLYQAGEILRTNR